MKTLFLIRHAKSSWENFTVSDEERPLNERGRKNAPEMARRLKQKGIAIDTFLSSSAKRARATAEYFAAEYGKPFAHIKIVPQLYMASNNAFLNVIRTAPQAASSI